MQPKAKPDGFKYQSYILIYTVDILIIDHEPKIAMDHIALQYALTPGSVKELDLYLRSQVSKFYIKWHQ
jgi:hypothetical protein